MLPGDNHTDAREHVIQVLGFTVGVFPAETCLLLREFGIYSQTQP